MSVGDLGGALYVGNAPWRSFKVSLVLVGTTATPLPATALTDRKGIFLWNSSTISIFLGDVNVGTSSDGRLGAGASVNLPVSEKALVYGRVASTPSTLAVWEYA